MDFDLDSTLKANLSEFELDFVNKILYGSTTFGTESSSGLSITHLQKLDICPDAKHYSRKYDIDIFTYSLLSEKSESNKKLDSIDPSIVKIALFQNKIVEDSGSPVETQLKSLHELGKRAVKIAYLEGANIFCFQELWTMPMGFCTGAKLPWVEFAECITQGPTTHMLKKLAKEYNMVIISPILERDNNDMIWNTAVVIDCSGEILGISRKVHIPIAGNEMCYYQPSNIPPPVFETKFGRIALNICYDRHHPQNWYYNRINGAQIVLNPSASLSSFSEHLWPIEARAAAISNGFFVGAINRVGVEEFENGSNKKSREFYGSTYFSSPNGIRTPGLSRHKNGVLIAEIDLIDCKEHILYKYPLYKIAENKTEDKLLEDIANKFNEF